MKLDNWLHVKLKSPVPLKMSTSVPSEYYLSALIPLISLQALSGFGISEVQK